MLVYDSIYENIGLTHTVIYTSEEMGEYSPSKKGMELQRNFSFILSIMKEISLETHKIFHPENNW